MENVCIAATSPFGYTTVLSKVGWSRFRAVLMLIAF